MDRIGTLKDFLKQNPSDSFLKHALGLEYVKLGQDGLARTQFEEVIEHDPGYIGSYYHLGKLLLRTGQPDLAKEWFKKGMDAARTAGDVHAFNEMRTAMEDLD